MAGEAKKFLHSDEINEWDKVFDPITKKVKCEYTEKQLVRFAEIWAKRTISKLTILEFIKSKI